MFLRRFFIRSFILVFLSLFVHPLVCLFIHSFIFLFVHSFIHSITFQAAAFFYWYGQPVGHQPLVVYLCVSECVSESVPADMSPYCSAHDEWLIMKLCMYVGYHDANNVSNFGGDPVTQLHFLMFKEMFTLFYGHGAP